MASRSPKTSQSKTPSPQKPVKPNDGFEVVGQPYARLYLADDIRSEASGKVLALGLYSDLVVIVGIPADAPPPTEQVPYGIPRLSFMVTVGGVSGAGPVTVQLADGALEKTVQASIKPGHSANLIFSAEPMLFKSFGNKKVTVKLAGHTLHLDYEIRKQILDEAQLG